MHTGSLRVVTSGRLHICLSCILLAGSCLGTPSAFAAVSFDSQLRDVSAFTMISFPAGEDPFCSEQVSSQEPGVFAETTDCVVEEAGSQATALAGQLSYIFPHLFLAEGSFDAHAEISGEADFA